jgi:hypothetical protein
MVESTNPHSNHLDMPHGFGGAKAKIVFRLIENIYQFHKE